MKKYLAFLFMIGTVSTFLNALFKLHPKKTSPSERKEEVTDVEPEMQKISGASSAVEARLRGEEKWEQTVQELQAVQEAINETSQLIDSLKEDLHAHLEKKSLFLGKENYHSSNAWRPVCD